MHGAFLYEGWILQFNHWQLDYCRNWLISARAYNIQQQENMRLTKSMHLTGNMRLIKSAKTRWAGHV